MKTTPYQIPFHLIGAGRSTDEEYERVEPLHEAFWRDERGLLEWFSYEHAGCSISVHLNWGPYVERLQKNKEIWGPIYQGKAPDLDEYRKLPKKIEFLAHVDITGENDFTKYAWYPKHFLEAALYDAFICANLALPGVLDLYGAEIPSNMEAGFPNELKLSSYNFEFWWIESLRGKFPKLRQLPLKKVREWHALSGIGGKSRAQTGLDRSIFSLLHLCRSANYVDGLIWMFHALEALLGTRVGDNLSGMTRRPPAFSSGAI